MEVTIRSNLGAVGNAAFLRKQAIQLLRTTARQEPRGHLHQRTAPAFVIRWEISLRHAEGDCPVHLEEGTIECGWLAEAG